MEEEGEIVSKELREKRKYEKELARAQRSRVKLHNAIVDWQDQRADQEKANALHHIEEAAKHAKAAGL
jgi:hypothetical protein